MCLVRPNTDAGKKREQTRFSQYCRNGATRPVVLLSLLLAFAPIGLHSQQKDPAREFWDLHPEFSRLAPHVVAVVPMVNMTADLEASQILQDAVYERLQAKGYQRIDARTVAGVMSRLGVQTPEMLAGISYERIGTELRADAVLQGEINQSGTQHGGVYDSVVVSCSLRLVDCRTGQVLWSADQWRAAHRQWQADPFNFIINMASHEGASRPARITWLAQEMLRTLPAGPVRVVVGDLLSQAIEIRAETDGTAPSTVPQAARRMVTVYFDHGSAEITPDAGRVLNLILSTLAGSARESELVVTGYRDVDEPDAGPIRLAVARGQACLEWVAARVPGAVGRARVTEGQADTRDPMNRRVDIAVVPRG